MEWGCKFLFWGPFWHRETRKKGGGKQYGAYENSKNNPWMRRFPKWIFLLFSQVAHTLHTHIHYARGDDSNRSYFVTSFFPGESKRRVGAKTIGTVQGKGRDSPKMLKINFKLFSDIASLYVRKRNAYSQKVVNPVPEPKKHGAKNGRRRRISLTQIFVLSFFASSCRKYLIFWQIACGKRFFSFSASLNWNLSLVSFGNREEGKFEPSPPLKNLFSSCCHTILFYCLRVFTYVHVCFNISEALPHLSPPPPYISSLPSSFCRDNPSLTPNPQFFRCAVVAFLTGRLEFSRFSLFFLRSMLSFRVCMPLVREEKTLLFIFIISG